MALTYERLQHLASQANKAKRAGGAIGFNQAAKATYLANCHLQERF